MKMLQHLQSEMVGVRGRFSGVSFLKKGNGRSGLLRQRSALREHDGTLQMYGPSSGLEGSDSNK